MKKSKIEWTDVTWNPITGCSKLSPGCQNCYAERMSKRLAGRYGYDKLNPFSVTIHHDRMFDPLRWRKSRMVFVCSMGDLFHEDVDDVWLDFVFGTIAACENNELLSGHIFQILTKRPDRMLKYLSDPGLRGRLARVGAPLMEQGDQVFDAIAFEKGPLKNVWCGVTIEDQDRADERIPILLGTPAVIRFVSVEPMLSQIELGPYNLGAAGRAGRNYQMPQIDWVICGGENGPGSRPMKTEWALDLLGQCRSASVPFLFKRHGTHHDRSNPLGFVGDLQNHGRRLQGKIYDELPNAFQ